MRLLPTFSLSNSPERRTIYQKGEGKMNTYGITLLSGGLDSATVTSYATGLVDHLTAVTFQYGQSHAKEIECAKKIASLLNIKHQLLDLSLLTDVSWYSALTNPDSFPVPTTIKGAQVDPGIPITYVPLRNTIFLSLSAALLESQVLHAIEVENLEPRTVNATLYCASNAIDFSGYPDCRPEFFQHMDETLNHGSKLWAQYGIRMSVQTPIIHFTKSEIVQMSVDLKVPLNLTWSCYRGEKSPCRKCDSCVLRAKGFEQAAVTDPLL
jgi:7-cyano-7-deazaguanine synthase